MRRAIKFLFFSASIFHCHGQDTPIPSTSPVEAPVTAVVGGSTITETFTATILTQYASVTASSSVTITDDTGAILLAGAVFAGGLAWLLRPVPGTPILEVPSKPPTLTSEPSRTTQSTSSTTTTSTTTSTSALPTFSIRANSPPADFFTGPLAPIVLLVDDEKTCGFVDDDPAEVGRDDADKTINDFCKANNGKPVVSNAPIHQAATYNAGMILNLTVTQNSACASETDLTLDEDDCSSFFHETLDGCDTNTAAQKHGGTLNDNCFTYTLHPQDFEGDLDCSPFQTGTGVNRDQAKNSIGSFCKENDGKSVSPGSPLLNEMFKMDFGDSVLWLRARYNVEDQTCSQQGDAKYTLNERTCNRFFMLLLDGCNTNAGTHLGKYGGNLTDHCGLYSFDPLVSEPMSCFDIQDIFAGAAHTVPQAAGEAAINEFCDRKDAGLSAAPPDGNFVQFAPDVGNKQQPDGSVIRIQLNWAEGKFEQGCAPRKDYKVDPEDCKRKLKRILNECPKQNQPGGRVTDNLSHGCTFWSFEGKVPPKRRRWEKSIVG